MPKHFYIAENTMWHSCSDAIVYTQRGDYLELITYIVRQVTKLK